MVEMDPDIRRDGRLGGASFPAGANGYELLQ